MNVTSFDDRPGPPTPATAGELELTILMPCLNEAETLDTCIAKAQRFLAHHAIRGEVLVADNGSTDGSREIVQRSGARLVDVPIRGYGAAILHGTHSARGRYVIVGDSDDSYDFSRLELYVEQLRAGYEFVIGNRFAGGIRPGSMPWKNKWIGTPILSGIGRLFFHSPIRDFNCGLRGYTRKAFEAMDLRTTGMEFASEMVIKATLLGMKVGEVPTTLYRDGRSRPPHLRPWRDGWRHLRFMLLYSPRWLFLYPGIVLMVSSLLVGAWLLPGPRWLGRVGFDIHTLLFAGIGVLVGFQAMFFGVFSKTFAVSEGLLPADDAIEKAVRAVRLEVALIVGALLVLLGVGGGVYGVTVWERQGFGPLSPTHVMRIAIPSAVSIALGFQIMLSAFFLSVLHMGRR
jgi:glycosyltransferase involved in cell wall biosynthesis